ncbi:MAG: response associated peptidase [Cypionkella sp.]|uniref:SOS response-associated peptidase n=1 Tax=Cypionkella sp. TaxID=2811411 RepID=UPI00262DBFFA|nr:SOS response-associated peptidase [Cypionkella sp.]MDB5659417.1 response associated peptidase [Cypionkella sp.]
MCNLYNMTRAVEAMRQLFAGLENRAGNLEPGDVYPDRLGAIVTATPQGHALHRARWGLPSPQQFHSKSGIDRGVTNIRNPAGPHWRRWLSPNNRCLVPFDRFAEPNAGKGAGNSWFAPADGRPAFFAGIWVPEWRSLRKLKDGETTDDLFAFLTTEPNIEVERVHPKAMPVILTEPADWEAWLSLQWSEARVLQRPLPNGSLVATFPTDAVSDSSYADLFGNT